jgi:hypothetical protein
LRWMKVCGLRSAKAAAPLVQASSLLLLSRDGG